MQKIMRGGIMHVVSADPDSWVHLERELGDGLLERLDERSGLCELGPDICSFFMQHRFPVQYRAVLPDPSFETVISSGKLELPLDRSLPYAFQISANRRLDYSFGKLIPSLSDKLELSPALRADRNPEQIISIHLQCASEVRVYAGCSTPEHNLSPWSRGVCRIPRSKDAVSRAESKLEEALELLPVLSSGLALDLGAAPGGWTRVLVDHGFEVQAVDPAELDPQVECLAGVTHHRTTAGDFLAQDDRRYDIVVSDMKMDPMLLAGLLTGLDGRIKSGGTLVATLKLGRKGNPLPLLDRTLEQLRQAYTIVQARQLYFNRNEVSVIGRALRP